MRGLAAPAYTDPAYFAAERDRILAPSWQIACHVADLPGPGTAIRFDFGGRSAVLLRARDGAIRGFLNVCRHRGSRLIDGDPITGLAFCVDGRIRCPYHAWGYDETGALVHVPREGEYPDLERGALGLRPLPVETCAGFVFVAFAPPVGPVADGLGRCSAELETYRIASMRRITEPALTRHRANWKLLYEHGLDSIRPTPGTERAVEPRDAVLRISGAIAAPPATSWSARAYDRWLPVTPHLPATEQRRWASYFVWPNLRLDLTPDQLRLSQLLPQGPGETVVREVGYALPDSSRPMRLARYLTARLRRRAAASDRRISERVQAGLATGDYEPGPIGSDEVALAWFLGRLRAALPENSPAVQ